MQLLFLVIKRIELVDEIMRSLAQAGIRGGTVIDSVGMAKSISTMDNLPMIGVLRSILSGEDAAQKGKTIFVAVADDQVDVAKALHFSQCNAFFVDQFIFIYETLRE